MFSAISGLKVNQTMLDVTANDLANVNTVGYKAARATFQDSLAQLQRGAAGANQSSGGSNALQVGLGVQLGSVDNMMSGGAPETTGNPLDVYIQGPGWLRVGLGDGRTVPSSFEYTRAGNLNVNAAGQLTTADGHYLVGLGATATPDGSGGFTYAPNATDTYLTIPPGSTDVTIGQDGGVSYIDQDSRSTTFGQRVTAGYLALAKFPNEGGLQRSGGSLWTASASTGAATVGTPNTSGFGQTNAGMLEMSNVDLATEFTTMITAQRGFQANSRVISTADQMLQDLVNLKQ
ncbi:MAG TPA: flagellar hook-basal body complex protein [Conexibacter sp.]|nr:flagellar hook-basal body complex protein [Conexibacter sp.]